MSRRNPQPRPTPPPTPLEQAFKDLRHPAQEFQTVSARWLLSAAAVSVIAAALCAWGVLCFLFAQGSWQLLYHPTTAITQTPAAANLAFDPIAFAPNDSGVPQLAGWWISAAPGAPYTRFTVLYLHGQDGNLSDTVTDLAFLHSIGLNVFAFDYRGYGQSHFAHPTETKWLADAGYALTYLTQTRHIPPNAIVVDGKYLGANLALEFAASHSNLAGTILDQPLDLPVRAVFDDPRAALVPAHLLVRDRYDSDAAASALRVPALWFNGTTIVIEEKAIAGVSQSAAQLAALPHAYVRIDAPKTIVSPATRTGDADIAAQRSAAITRWLDDLSVNPARP